MRCFCLNFIQVGAQCITPNFVSHSSAARSRELIVGWCNLNERHDYACCFNNNTAFLNFLVLNLTVYLERKLIISLNTVPMMNADRGFLDLKRLALPRGRRLAMLLINGQF